MYYQTKVLTDYPLSYFEGAACGYLSLITDDQRLVENAWTASGHGCVIYDDFQTEADPKVDSPMSRIKLNTVSASGTTTITSPVLNRTMRELYDSKPIGVGAWIYVPSSLTDSITVHYRYNNGSWQDMSATTYLPQIAEATWIFVSHTFDISSIPLGDYDQQIAFDISFSSPGNNDDWGDYDYLINGIVIGQRADNMLSSCRGQPEAYDVSSLNGGDGVLSINEYGGRLTSVVEGTPLHYGLVSATMLNPWIPERPSMSLANSGFMGDSNAIKATTLEFWLKISKASNKPVRIVGPEGSTDGIYINRTTVILSISGTEVGYDIGTIDYPMLIHWVVGSSGSYLMINSETVIEVIDPPDTSYFSSSTNIGFYTDESIHPVHISSIATYPYPVPSIVAKARFVRGQGTIQYGLIADQFDGKSFSADFSTANFSNNLSYPDTVNWNRGVYNNIVATNKIELPKYQLPEVIDVSSTEVWYDLNKDMLSIPSVTATIGDTTTLDNSSDNTSGTPFTNTSLNGSVYTTVATASSRTCTIPVSGLKFGAKLRIHGEAKYAGTDPYMTVTFVGPGTNHTVTFEDNGDGKSVVDAEFDIPTTTTSITWGVAVDAGMTFGQFDNIYCQFVYERQPFYMIPTGYDTEPAFQWGSLNFLNRDSVASITSNMVFDDTDTDASLLSISKRGTATRLDVYLSGGTVTYEYSDYTESLILNTFDADDGEQFTIGVAIKELVDAYPVTSPLFSQPSDVDIAFGGNGFSGAIYDISFHNGWHHNKLEEYTYTDGIADENIRSIPEESPISTYTLIAVTEFGNFTLDVACKGYWQETVPVSFFVKEVADRYGTPRDRIDFIQSNIGKTRATMEPIEEKPITYFQLQQNYWGMAYSSMDVADYAELASTMYTVFDPSEMDVQTWISMQKLSDDIVDFTEKTAVDVYDSPVTYLDSDGRKHLIQDGYSIILPYTYDLSKYVLVSYHLIESSGVRSNPTKLKSYELTSWASEGDRWSNMVSKEGNNVSPYVSNGSYFVYEYPNIFEITKRGYNYLYKSHRSGWKPRSNDLPGYNSGLALQWSRSAPEEEPRQFAGYSMFIHHEGNITESKMITRILVGGQKLLEVYAIPVGTSQYSLSVVDQYGNVYNNIAWYVNGKIVNNPTFNVMEWHMLQCALIDPYDTDGQIVTLMITGKEMSFDNITIHGRMNAIVRGVTVYRRWVDLIGEDWDYWSSAVDDWRGLYDTGTIVNINIEPDRMTTTLTGVAPEAQFSASCGVNFQETFVVRDLEWANMDVSTK